jgi:DNA invertase Pin-like site-specific DNA recombinase
MEAVLGEFVKVESGKKATRPQVRVAVQLAQRQGAVLVIAKLDRLSRNVAIIASLIESRVALVACDQRQANKFTRHLFAALAEQKRNMISERTRRALQVLKTQGKPLGTPANLTQQVQAQTLAVRQQNARTHKANRQATALILTRRVWAITRLRKSTRAWAFLLAVASRSKQVGRPMIIARAVAVSCDGLPALLL